MNQIKKWLLNEDNRNFIFVIISGLALLFSLFGWFKTDIPFDVAWIAIML